MERMIPEVAQQKPFAWKHHVNRYKFACQFASGKIVLDIGCGAAYGTKMLREEGKARTVIGLDITQTVRDAGTLAEGDAQCLPFANSQFELVIAFEVIEHVDEPEKVMSEIFRVLTPAGVALISTPRCDFWGKPYSSQYHKIEFSPREFDRLLSFYFPEREMLGQYFDHSFTELPPRGFGLRRLLTPVSLIFGYLDGTKPNLRGFDLIPWSVERWWFVPKYMTSICKKNGKTTNRWENHPN